MGAWQVDPSLPLAAGASGGYRRLSVLRLVVGAAGARKGPRAGGFVWSGGSNGEHAETGRPGRAARPVPTGYPGRGGRRDDLPAVTVLADAAGVCRLVG